MASTCPPTSLMLPPELFLLLGSYLDTQTLSRLSCTCHRLHALLALTLKRHHIFRLVGTYLIRTKTSGLDSESYNVCEYDRVFRPTLHTMQARTNKLLPLFRLSRTCRALHHALVPLIKSSRLYCANTFISWCTGDNRPVELKRCLAAVGTCSFSALRGVCEGELHYAAGMAYAEVMQLFLDYGISTLDDGWRGNYWDTPLSQAVQQDNLEIARILLEKGARNARAGWDFFGKFEGVSSEMVSLLHGYGVDVMQLSENDIHRPIPRAEREFFYG